MGSDKSSHANAKSNTEEYPKGLFQTGESVGGLKASSSDSDVILVNLSEVISLSSTDWESSDSEGYDSEDGIEEDPEVEEFLAERRMILDEAKMLKNYAHFHLHPEKNVVTKDTFACGRNFFSRPDADETENLEVAEEMAKVLEEAALLKQYAKFHLHPERPVVSSDAMVCGRNFFVRASAPEQESVEEAEERAMVLEEAAMLKQYAEFHLHPERPVVSTDPLANGRNYFCRPSALLNGATIKGRVSDGKERKIKEPPVQVIRKQVTLHQAPHKHSTKDGNEIEEVMINRSPSSIMLFGYEDDEAF
jgi:hypothetical protein